MKELKQLRLNTLTNSRKSYARVIAAYMRGDMEETKARTLGYLLSGLLQYWKAEKDFSIEERLDALEKKLKEISREK